jgi:hypothetical protein
MAIVDGESEQADSATTNLTTMLAFVGTAAGVLADHVRPSGIRARLTCGRHEQNVTGVCQEESLTGQNGQARGRILRPSRHR